MRPEEASRELLPDGFPFDPGYGGLKALKFGEALVRRSAEQKQKNEIAKAAGFANSDVLERARRFAALPESEQERILSERDKAADLAAVPDHAPANPTRRTQNTSDKAKVAPNKESETRPRSVSIGREDVKDQAADYLRLHYRNKYGDMTCQVCKGPLPFKLDDGSEFFEVVECLPELRKRHFQNYLALCPNHSAMYRHANASKHEMRDEIASMTENELDVVLGQKELTMYFSKLHIMDLKAVIAAENELSDESDGESSDSQQVAGE